MADTTKKDLMSETTIVLPATSAEKAAAIRAAAPGRLIDWCLAWIRQGMELDPTPPRDPFLISEDTQGRVWVLHTHKPRLLAMAQPMADGRHLCRLVESFEPLATTGSDLGDLLDRMASAADQWQEETA